MHASIESFERTSTSTDLSARDLLSPVFRRKSLLSFVFLSIFILAMLFALIKGPVYSSHMEILVNRERLDPLVSTEATTQMITNSTPVTVEEVNSEVALLTSRDVLEQVVVTNHLDVQSPGLSLDSLLHPNSTHRDRIARAVTTLAKKLKTEVTTKTDVIGVTYSSPDPDRSYSVLKSLGEFYTAKHVTVHRPAGSYDFFATQTNKYRQDLASAESQLRNTAKVSGIADPEEQRSGLAQQVASSIGLLHLAEQTVSSDEARLEEDENELLVTPQRSVTVQSSATNDKLVEDLHATLLAAQAKKAQLAVKYAPGFPLMAEAEEEVTQAKAAIQEAENKRYVTESTDRDPAYDAVREDAARTRADLAAQRATLDATRHSISNIRREMVDLDQQSMYQQDLEREVKANETNYLLYLSKREQERTTDALDNTRIANVAIAVPPELSTIPVLSWPLLTIISLGAALLLSFVAVWAATYLDSSFHTPAQVASALGIPIVIPISRKSA